MSTGRRGVFLGERFENRLNVFRSDSGSGINDRDANGGVGVDGPHLDAYRTFVGKLDRVGNEVGDDLTQTVRIARERRDRRIDVD